MDLNSIDTLRAITSSLQTLPRLLQLVRSVYRQQNRKPQDEPTVVTWVERYARFYQTKPLGLLDATHARAFLSHLSRRPGMTVRQQEEAREAIAFFHTEVLQQDLEPITGYDQAPAQTPAVAATGPSTPERSFWTLQDAAS